MVTHPVHANTDGNDKETTRTELRNSYYVASPFKLKQLKYSLGVFIIIFIFIFNTNARETCRRRRRKVVCAALLMQFKIVVGVYAVPVVFALNSCRTTHARKRMWYRYIIRFSIEADDILNCAAK